MVNRRPGNCRECAKFYNRLRPSLPTPCTDCPKYHLFNNPRWPGLDPRNEFVWHLYRMASEDVRAGDSGYLTRTLSSDKAIAILDEPQYAVHITNWLVRQELLEGMHELGSVALVERQKVEEHEREVTIAKAKAQAEAKKKGGR